MRSACKPRRQAGVSLKRLVFTTFVAVLLLGGISGIVLLRYDPEIPDDVLRHRLEAKLLGHDAKDIDPVFSEEHIERTNQMGMDGIMLDAGHEDIVMLKHIYVRIHTDDRSRITSIETEGRWVGP